MFESVHHYAQCPALIEQLTQNMKDAKHGVQPTSGDEEAPDNDAAQN